MYVYTYKQFWNNPHQTHNSCHFYYEVIMDVVMEDF